MLEMYISNVTNVDFHLNWCWTHDGGEVRQRYELLRPRELAKKISFSCQKEQEAFMLATEHYFETNRLASGSAQNDKTMNKNDAERKKGSEKVSKEVNEVIDKTLDIALKSQNISNENTTITSKVKKA